MQRLFPLTLIAILAIGLIIACKHEPPVQPGGGGLPIPGCTYTDICFESDVLPIFQSSCAKTGCHNAASAEGGYVLDSYANIIKKGVKPGNAGASKLYTILFKTGGDQMPPLPSAPLSQAQRDSIGKWINSGAKNTVNCNCNCDTAKFTYAAVIKPIMDGSCVGCHNTASLGGGINLSNHAAVKAVAVNGKLMGSITHAAGYIAMPQGGKLSDCQIKQVDKWIKAGSLNN